MIYYRAKANLNCPNQQSSKMSDRCFIFSVFIASRIPFKITSLHVPEGFQKNSKNRKHLNVKENQLSKLYSLPDGIPEHHKTTGMGHRVLLKTHPRRGWRESGKSG